MSMRRFQALVAGLPAEGATARALGERAAVGWSVDSDLLALIAELLDYGNRQQFVINSKPGKKPPRPLDIPRPEDARKRRERRKATAEDLKEIFGDGIVRPDA